MCRRTPTAVALLLSMLAAATASAGERPAEEAVARGAGVTTQTTVPLLHRSERKEEIVEEGAGERPQERSAAPPPAPGSEPAEDLVARDRAAIMRGRNAPAPQALNQPQPFTMPELPMSALLYALLAIGVGLHMLGRLNKKANTETVREWSDAVEMPGKPVIEAAPPRVTTPPKAERVPAVQSVQRMRAARPRGDLPPVPNARGGFGRRV